MNKQISGKLNQLKERVHSGDFINESKKARLWGGADVIIASKMTPEIERWLSDEPTIISAQKTLPRKRAVITVYGNELSWLFYQLGKVFREEIDYISKYDFYGILAQSAIDYLDNNKDSVNCKDLLLTAIKQAEGF